MEEQWYSYKKFNLLGVHKQTLNNWRRNGNIIYKKLSPKIFFIQTSRKYTIR